MKHHTMSKRGEIELWLEDHDCVQLGPFLTELGATTVDDLNLIKEEYLLEIGDDVPTQQIENFKRALGLFKPKLNLKEGFLQQLKKNEVKNPDIFLRIIADCIDVELAVAVLRNKDVAEHVDYHLIRHATPREHMCYTFVRALPGNKNDLIFDTPAVLDETHLVQNSLVRGQAAVRRFEEQFDVPLAIILRDAKFQAKAMRHIMKDKKLTVTEATAAIRENLNAKIVVSTLAGDDYDLQHEERFVKISDDALSRWIASMLRSQHEEEFGDLSDGTFRFETYEGDAPTRFSLLTSECPAKVLLVYLDPAERQKANIMALEASDGGKAGGRRNPVRQDKMTAERRKANIKALEDALEKFDEEFPSLAEAFSDISSRLLAPPCG